MIRLLLLVCVLLSSPSLWAKTLNGFDVSNSIIPIKEIVHGGPPRDGIPAINNPHYVSSKEAGFMRPEDIVLGFEIAGQSYAFPRHIMNWHELVNDEINGEPFVVSYCPLCGSGMAFSSKLRKDTLTFGVSGLLYNNDLIFYDKNTESLWSQLEGKAISGPYVQTKLEQLNLSHTTWANWSNLHPQTKVLSEQQGVKRNYRHDPYSGYETSSAVFFKTLRKVPKDYHTKERVMGVQIGSNIKAYPYVELRKTGKTSFEDTLGGERYRIFWDNEHETAAIETLSGKRVVSTTSYWFAWYSFYPNTEVYREVK